MFVAYCNPEENSYYCGGKSLIGLSPLVFTAIYLVHFCFDSIFKKRKNSAKQINSLNLKTITS